MERAHACLTHRAHAQALLDPSALDNVNEAQKHLLRGYLRTQMHAHALAARLAGHSRLARTPLDQPPALAACTDLPFLASALTRVLVQRGHLTADEGAQTAKCGPLASFARCTAFLSV